MSDATLEVLDKPGLAARIGAAIGRIETLPFAWLFAPKTLSLRFVLATLSAGLGALYIAFLLDFNQPHWAIMTVFIVASPLPGQVFEKGLFRFAGTIVGASMAVVLIGAFDQMPELLLFALACWLALCTGVSTLLRGFRAYGAVLAGYTCAIITLAAAAAPSQVFILAVYRASEISLGVTSMAVASILFLPGSARGAVQQRLIAALMAAVRALAELLHGREGEPPARLVGELGAIRAMVDTARSEDGRFRRLEAMLRATINGIFALKVASQGLRLAALSREWQIDAMVSGCRALTEVRTFLTTLPASPSPDHSRTLLRPQISALMQALDDVVESTDVKNHAAVQLAMLCQRCRLTLVHLEATLLGLEAMATGRSVEIPQPRRALAVHIDWRQAATNALRTFIAVSVASALWIGSAWNSGAGMLTITAVICSLFAATDRPHLAAMGFLKALGVGGVLAVLYKAAIFPVLDGFPLLALTLAPALAWSSLGAAGGPNPSGASATSMLFLSMLVPANKFTFDAVSTFQDIGSTAAGVIFSAIAFLIILPKNLPRMAREQMAAVRADALRQLRIGTFAEISSFGTRCFDRLARALQLGAPVPLLLGAMSAVAAGVEAGRLRELELSPAVRLAIDEALERLNIAVRSPTLTPEGQRAELAGAIEPAMETIVTALAETPGAEQRQLWQGLVSLDTLRLASERLNRIDNK